jgi:hypothetical protein
MDIGTDGSPGSGRWRLKQRIPPIRSTRSTDVAWAFTGRALVYVSKGSGRVLNGCSLPRDVETQRG